MIDFDEFFLDNGLRVLVHRDDSTPIVAFNITYNVGSRDEDENRTGFAHLFEHLMFGGSINIASFDAPLQVVGGENNAFTSNDITNYYMTLPKDSLETAFWLESDRMLNLAFSKKSLDVQRQVVIEEFKQRYLNQPYGDVFLKLRPLAYDIHPYKWATIGKEIEHIENAKMEDVKSFFSRFYRPNNAVLAVAGNVDVNLVKQLSEKWFGPIEAGEKNLNQYPIEPIQNQPKRIVHQAKVPFDAIFIAFHMPGRLDKDYYACDLLSDVLSRGNSSRFYQSLVKKLHLFSEISSYVSGDDNPGLFIISGNLLEHVSFEQAEQAIYTCIEELIVRGLKKNELMKVVNKVRASSEYANCSILNRAMGLAIGGVMGNSNLINEDMDNYQSIQEEDIMRVARSLLVKNNSSTLIYKKL